MYGDFVLRQERTELVLERMFLVMFFLASDVFRNRGYVRFTYAEDSVSGLPAEFRAAFANPARGVCFYDAGDLSWGVRWARAHEDMNVIDGSINYQSGAMHFANDAAEVGERSSRNSGLINGRRSRVLNTRWRRILPQVWDISFAPPGLGLILPLPTACAVGWILALLRRFTLRQNGHPVLLAIYTVWEGGRASVTHAHRGCGYSKLGVWNQLR
jgi:hypothetical protein